MACGITSAQTIKTYNGKMSKEPIALVKFGFALYMTTDNWTYQYYENDNGDRVFHGNLTYKLLFGKNWIYTVTGKFSHGKKEGTWEYKAISDNKEIAKFVVNYHNDLLEGNFEYFVAHGKNEITSMNGMFQNGDLVGVVKYKNAGLRYSYNYMLNYMEGGYPIGIWKFNEKSDINYDHEMRFINGFLVSMKTTDQSTGERKESKADNVELVDFIGYAGKYKVLVSESMAKMLSPNNRKFKGLKDYYEVTDENGSSIEYAVFDVLGSKGYDAIKKIHEIYTDIGYTPRYLAVSFDTERNREVRDSLEEVRILQDKQARLAEEAAREQKRIEAQQAKEQLEAQLKDLELKIDQTIALRKNAEKWENLIGVFRICAKDKPNDKNWTLQFFTCVYRILNSDIDSNSRNQYEEKISTEAMKARSGANRAGGWFCYCDYKKLLNDCINLSADLNLVEMDSIPEFTEEEILKYNKILEKRNKVMEKLYGR